MSDDVVHSHVSRVCFIYLMRCISFIYPTVSRVSFIYPTRWRCRGGMPMPHTSGMPHSHIWNGASTMCITSVECRSHVWNACGLSRSYASLTHLECLTHTSGMPHSHIWNASLTHLECLTHTSGMPHTHMWNAASTMHAACECIYIHMFNAAFTRLIRYIRIGAHTQNGALTRLMPCIGIAYPHHMCVCVRESHTRVYASYVCMCERV